MAVFYSAQANGMTQCHSIILSIHKMNRAILEFFKKPFTASVVQCLLCVPVLTKSQHQTTWSPPTSPNTPMTLSGQLNNSSGARCINWRTMQTPFLNINTYLWKKNVSFANRHTWITSFIYLFRFYEILLINSGYKKRPCIMIMRQWEIFSKREQMFGDHSKFSGTRHSVL